MLSSYFKTLKYNIGFYFFKNFNYSILSIKYSKLFIFEECLIGFKFFIRLILS